MPSWRSDSPTPSTSQSQPPSRSASPLSFSAPTSRAPSPAPSSSSSRRPSSPLVTAQRSGFAQSPHQHPLAESSTSSSNSPSRWRIRAPRIFRSPILCAPSWLPGRSAAADSPRIEHDLDAVTEPLADDSGSVRSRAATAASRPPRTSSSSSSRKPPPRSDSALGFAHDEDPPPSPIDLATQSFNFDVSGAAPASVRSVAPLRVSSSSTSPYRDSAHGSSSPALAPLPTLNLTLDLDFDLHLAPQSLPIPREFPMVPTPTPVSSRKADAAAAEYVAALNARAEAAIPSAATKPARAIDYAKKLLAKGDQHMDVRKQDDAYVYYYCFLMTLMKRLNGVHMSPAEKHEHAVLSRRLPEIMDRCESLKSAILAARAAAAPTTSSDVLTGPPGGVPARTTSVRTAASASSAGSASLPGTPTTSGYARNGTTAAPPARIDASGIPTRSSSVSELTSPIDPALTAGLDIPYLGLPAAPSVNALKSPTTGGGGDPLIRRPIAPVLTNATYLRSAHDKIIGTHRPSPTAPQSMQPSDDTAAAARIRRSQRARESIYNPMYWDGVGNVADFDIYTAGAAYPGSNVAKPSTVPAPISSAPMLPSIAPRASSLAPIERPPAVPGPRLGVPNLPPRLSPAALAARRSTASSSNMTSSPVRSSLMASSPSSAYAGAAADFRFHDSNAALSQVARSHGVVGLKNLGNSCYQNSILQCLQGTVPLARFFASGEFRSHVNPKNPLGTGGKVARAFFDLIQDMVRSSGTTVAPVAFRDMLADVAPHFATREQQDSQEFLTYLLDALHEDLKQPPPPNAALPPDDNDDLATLDPHDAGRIAWDRYLVRNASFVTHLFQGMLRSQLRCLTCGATSVTFAPFTSLSLPLPAAGGGGGGVAALEACLDEFLRPEILDGDDAWRCPACKCARRSEKSTLITRFPAILVVHLKRFSYAGPFRNKLMHLVQFPIRALNLNEYLGYPRGADALVYDLYGVSNHYGGLDGGHYTAAVQHGDDWHYFDDSRVSPCAQEKIVTNAAYTLFYVRRRDGGGGGAGASKL
ncbi:ubiquitin-specific protease doa4 [Blastocladiella emersonii ATCC 22665]|nr:ubiquitin-specific protease doa4 [Blastocladiella emersonii ATCC 22665]